MGAPAHLADDLAQEAFAITATNLVRIELGKEGAYFLSTAIRKVRESRRSFTRTSHAPADPASSEVGADALLDEARARAVLDASLAELEPDLRTVFVLHELEDLTMAEIGEALEIPAGTVASRLRRAREHWSAIVRGKMSLGDGGR
jgi:RNA polymerase sigma-70 factor (ECF subfamily)